MSRKHKFLRKCISCNEFKEKNELIKITRNYESGELIINPINNVFGRSAYICKNETCLNAALKKHKIEKNLKKNLNTDLNEILKTVLEE